MKLDSTMFLRLVIALIGLGVLFLCIFGLPPLILSDEVGEYRPILLGMYIPAIPFYIALFQSFKLLHVIDKNDVFSETSVKVLRKIKFCAVAIAALYFAGMPYIFYVAQRDDAPGVVAIGLVIIFTSSVIATASAVFQKLLQNAVAIKSENDLTV